jgi:uncharacterized protein (TIGR02611 family)
VPPRPSTRKPPSPDRPSFAARLGERRARHRQRARLYRVVFAVAGLGVLLAGIAMLVLPGPGLLVTGAGLAMLALEFAWAERLLSRVVARTALPTSRSSWRRSARSRAAGPSSTRRSSTS